MKHILNSILMILLLVLLSAVLVFTVTFGFLKHPDHFAFGPGSESVPQEESSSPEPSSPEESESPQPEPSEPSSETSEESSASSQEPSQSSEPESSAPERSETSGESSVSPYELDKEKVRRENPQAAQVLDSVGWDLKAAFDWVAAFPWQRMTVDYSMGAEWFAQYGYENQFGNCYVMAATFCDLAKALGYNARQMIGEVPMEHGGFGQHSWVEITLAGGTYVFDPDYVSETKKNGFMLTYEQGDTWVYMNYSPMP